MPPQIHWKDTWLIPFLENIYSNYHKQLVKRGSPPSRDVVALFVPIVILFIFPFIIWSILARRNRHSPRYNPNAPPDPKYLGEEYDEIGLEENKRYPEMKAPLVMYNQSTREPDDTPKLPVEDNVYQPPRRHVLEVGGDSVVRRPTPQPRGGLVYRPPLPEADGAAVVKISSQHQLQVSGAGGVLAGGENNQHQPQILEAEGTTVNRSHDHQRQQISGMGGAPREITSPQPIRAPLPVQRPAMPEMNGRAVVDELPGELNQSPHELGSARRGSYRWELVCYPPNAVVSGTYSQQQAL